MLTSAASSSPLLVVTSAIVEPEPSQYNQKMKVKETVNLSELQGPMKKREMKTEKGGNALAPIAPAPPTVLGTKKRTPEQSRALRLAQNRKAARESRRRKKALVEELQRSLVFFSRTNATLKQQNEDLTRRLLEAHSVLTKMGEPVPSLKGVQASQPQGNNVTLKLEASPLAPASKEATASPAACVIQPRPSTLPLPAMQPGATMQAMADFQQAAAVAMQAAENGIKASLATSSV